MAGQPNMQAMMKQVQKMQADMAKAQEELKNEVVEASAGGGMVTVKITGDLELREVRIGPEAVDPDDVEMLQDMVQAATNEAIRSAQELAASKMNAAAGGLDPRRDQPALRPAAGGALALPGARPVRAPRRHRADDRHRGRAGPPTPARPRRSWISSMHR
jgi:nucleoid-associated protein EbfC